MTEIRHSRPAAGAPRPYRFPAFSRQRVAAGIGLVTATVTKLPVVSVVAVIDAGGTRDPQGKAGLATLTAKLLLEGTERLSGSDLADAFEQLGASAEVHAGWDTAVVQLTVLRSNLDAAVNLLSEVLRTPAFRERDVQRLKAERRAERLQVRTEPRELADESLERYLYEPSSRYARPLGGELATIDAISREDISAFYHGRYVPQRTTVIMAGDVTAAHAGQLVESAFAGWTCTMTEDPPLSDRAMSAERRVQVVAKADAPQSELRIGHRGVPRSHEDYFPLTVMNAVLGGLFSSRINLNLRERHGYAYGAHSSFDWRRGHGPFVVSTAVESGVTADATREVVAEIENIREAPILAEELSLATSYLAGVFPIRYETTSALASALAALVTYDYPPDYFDTYRDKISAVTTEDVLRVARAHLHPEQLLVVAVGDATVIGSPLQRLGLGSVAVSEPAEAGEGT